MCLCFRPDEFKFGCTSLRVPPELLYQLRNDITVSPNGIAFVKVQLALTLRSDEITLCTYRCPGRTLGPMRESSLGWRTSSWRRFCEGHQPL